MKSCPVVTCAVSSELVKLYANCDVAGNMVSQIQARVKVSAGGALPKYALLIYTYGTCHKMYVVFIGRGQWRHLCRFSRG